MTVWKWADSFYLYLLPGVPLGLYLLLQWSQRLRSKLEKVLGPKVFPFLTSSISFRKERIKLYLFVASLVPLLLALARPQFGETKENIKSLGVELMILFDVSQSMLAEDISPSRLEFAKREAIRFLDKIPGSKVGLVAFAGSAALISPITTDASALKMFIESLNTEAISTQGTEFKMALEQAESAFQRGGQEGDASSKVTRVVLILSDGEDQEPGALEAAEKMADKGVRIFSVAVGTEKGGPIPLRDPNGFLRGYKKNSAGEVVQTTSSGKILKSLAQAGKGSFFTGSFMGQYLDQLVEDINKLDKTEFDSQIMVNYQERYQIFLGFALLLLMIEFWLGFNKAPSREWRGRFESGSR